MRRGEEEEEVERRRDQRRRKEREKDVPLLAFSALNPFCVW